MGGAKRMGFKVRTFEEIVKSMINWSLGVTDKISDYSVGSKIRTIYESFAIVLEEFYMNARQGLQIVVENSIYNAYDFHANPGLSATGSVVFSRNEPASEIYNIPAGTLVATMETSSMEEIVFETTENAQIGIGGTSAEAPVRARIEGVVGNVLQNTIVVIKTRPVGIEAVTNPSAFSTGVDPETHHEKRLRFIDWLESRGKGTPTALRYGAMEVPGVIDAAVVENPRSYILSYRGGVFHDYTEIANDPFYGDYSVFGGTPIVGDAVYVGADVKFDRIYFQLEQMAVNGAGVWEYYDGSSWAELSVTDGTNVFTQSGVVVFELPVAWVNSEVHNLRKFWTRFRLTDSGFTQMPEANVTFVSPFPGYVDVFIHDIHLDSPEALKTEVSQKFLDDYRGAGVVVNVREISVVDVNVEVNIKVDNLIYDIQDIENQIVEAVENHLNSLKLGEVLSKNELLQEIMEIPFYVALEELVISVPGNNLVPHAGEIIRPGVITVVSE